MADDELDEIEDTEETLEERDEDEDEDEADSDDDEVDEEEERWRSLLPLAGFFACIVSFALVFALASTVGMSDAPGFRDS